MTGTPETRKATRKSAYVVALMFLALGLLGFIVADSTAALDGYEKLKLVVIHVSALFVATFPLAVIWELLVHHDFLRDVSRELASVVGLSRLEHAITVAGLTNLQLIADFQGGIDWSSYFQAAREIDVFVGYAKTWRRSVGTHILAAARRGDFARLRVFLPDPNNREVLQELARRFNDGSGVSTDEIASRINEAVQDFKKWFAGSLDKLSIHFHAIPLMYSAYRFDDRAIIAFYKHRSARELAIPVVFFKRGGELFQFLEKEVEWVEKNSRVAS